MFHRNNIASLCMVSMCRLRCHRQRERKVTQTGKYLTDRQRELGGGGGGGGGADEDSGRERQRYRETDRQTGRQRGTATDRQADRQSEG